MALHIKAHWAEPVTITLGDDKSEIYSCREIDEVPSTPGVYIFARRHGKTVKPLYIGQTGNLNKRLCQHLDSVSLMKGIKAAPTGTRLFLYCEPLLRRGQKLARVLDVLENALIDHALSEGHELFNVQGTKRPSHSIAFSGNRTSEALVPRTMLLRDF